MNKVDSNMITAVLDKLIGRTEPCGESNTDAQRLDNLKTLIDVTNWCMDGLLQSASCRHSFAYSERENGQLAFSAMVEYQEWLKEIIEEEV